ncbi:MAG: hypothetical protein LBI27_05125, partial [Clostridiales bacterium]|nr:hypothetical protein [Clostridiales bacterium]
MKIVINKIVNLAVIMFFPFMFYVTFVSGIFPLQVKWLMGGHVRQIADTVMIELLPGEKLSAQYMTGFLQADGGVRVYVEGIESREDFLSRFGGLAEESQYSAGEYRIVMYGNDNAEIHGELHFIPVGEKFTARFFLYGQNRAEEYRSLYNLLYVYVMFRPITLISTALWTAVLVIVALRRMKPQPYEDSVLGYMKRRKIWFLSAGIAVLFMFFISSFLMLPVILMIMFEKPIVRVSPSISAVYCVFLAFISRNPVFLAPLFVWLIFVTAVSIKNRKITFFTKTAGDKM